MNIFPNLSLGNIKWLFLKLNRFRERRNADHVISVIGVRVRPTLGIIPSGHNTSGAGLLTPLRVGTIVTHYTSS